MDGHLRDEHYSLQSGLSLLNHYKGEYLICLHFEALRLDVQWEKIPQMCHCKSYQLPGCQESSVFSAVRGESYKVRSFVLLCSDACVLMLTKNNRGSNADI